MSKEVPEALAAKSGDRYTSDAMICSTCRDLLIRPGETIEQNTPASYNYETIVQSATEGCPICEIFYSTLRWDDNPETLEIMAVVTFEQKFPPSAPSSKLLASSISLRTDRDNGPERLVILLRKALSYGTISQILDESPSYYHNPVPILAAKTPIPRSYTGDHECVEQIASWLHDCVTNHADCNAGTSATDAAILPARLLDVGGTSARLTSTAELQTQDALSYLTLSHKWMIPGMPKLLRSNIEAMRYKVESRMLTPVFNDAIALAKALGIRFMWIDALCILQDDPEDLQAEIANMGHIYRNAYLNVGTLEACEGGDTNALPGLFVHRDPHYYSLFALKVQRADFKNDYLAYRKSSGPQLDHSPLMRRGWVLQERLLSRRSVYFGGQLSWECAENLASEALPTQLLGYNRFQFLDSSFRIPSLLIAPPETKNGYWNVLEGISLEVNYIYQNWARVVEAFSRCSLSFEQDYLVALSGLAQEFRATLKDEYYAGLWAKDMIRGLLWHRNTLHYEDVAVRPQVYRAPSWSWASVNLEISFSESYRVVTSNIIAEIIEVSTQPVGPDPTGRILDGRLRITGHIRRSTRSISKRYTKRMNTWSKNGLSDQYEWFEEGYHKDGSRDMNGCFFFLMAYHKPKTAIDPERPRMIFPVGHVDGLILEEVGTEESVYRRIGAFKHVWGEERTFEDNPLPEDYPEFLDFDPENFELHTITII